MSAFSQNRTLALPKKVGHWSLTTLREKLVKIGAKVVSNGRYVTFQLAEEGFQIPKSCYFPSIWMQYGMVGYETMHQGYVCLCPT